MKNRISNFFSKLKDTIKKPEMRILPGQLAFFLLLSIIPLLMDGKSLKLKVMLTDQK